MGRVVPMLGACLWVLSVPGGAGAQGDTDRIWARVETGAGQVHEGFVRWDRNEAGWADVLDGSKPLPRELYRVWIRAMEGEEADRIRTVELMGFRISWEEDDPEFPSWSDAGIRFGHLRELRVAGDDAAHLVLKTGREVSFERGGTDLGRDLREVVVEDRDGDSVELRWSDLARVVFSQAPPGARASQSRLYGTVRDRWGRQYEGYLSWDRDEILSGDVLDGEAGGDERRIPFARIDAIERTWEGARITTVDGEETTLTGSNDVGRGHRGVQVSDPDLGLVDIPWDHVGVVRFHPPPTRGGYDAFDGGRRIRGTVRTRAGEEISGDILWDADEEWTWEILDGSYRDVRYQVEFAAVDRIRRASSRGARVVLRDGRELVLEDSNDVSDGNRGIFVAREGVPEGVPLDEVEWAVVSWDDLDEVWFHHE